MLQRLHETKIYKKTHQFFKFCIVGGSNFLISLLVYNFVLWIFRCFPNGIDSSNSLVSLLFRYDYQIANVLAFVISVLNAYILNRVWVFKKEAQKTAEGAVFRFFASYGSTFLLSLFLAWAWVELLSISKIYVPYLNVLITTPLNFLLSKYFAFMKKKSHKEGIELVPFETEKEKTDGKQDT